MIPVKYGVIQNKALLKYKWIEEDVLKIKFGISSFCAFYKHNEGNHNEPGDNITICNHLVK